jgi:hypothetical protein
MKPLIKQLKGWENTWSNSCSTRLQEKQHNRLTICFMNTLLVTLYKTANFRGYALALSFSRFPPDISFS